MEKLQLLGPFVAYFMKLQIINFKVPNLQMSIFGPLLGDVLSVAWVGQSWAIIPQQITAPSWLTSAGMKALFI